MEPEKHGDIRQEDFPDTEKLERVHDEVNDIKDPLVRKLHSNQSACHKF